MLTHAWTSDANFYLQCSVVYVCEGRIGKEGTHRLCFSHEWVLRHGADGHRFWDPNTFGTHSNLLKHGVEQVLNFHVSSDALLIELSQQSWFLFSVRREEIPIIPLTKIFLVNSGPILLKLRDAEVTHNSLWNVLGVSKMPAFAMLVPRSRDSQTLRFWDWERRLRICSSLHLSTAP